MVDVSGIGRDTRGLIMNIMRFCIHDGPGIRTVVFLKGCPLRCSWCHNPEGQEPDKELAIRLDRCIRCGDCLAHCPNKAVKQNGKGYETDRNECERCGTCEDVCPTNARELVGKEMTVGALFGEVLKDVAFFDQSGGGVTFSGGEPLMQPKFLYGALSSLKAAGIHTAVETTAFSNRELLDNIAAVSDLLLVDLKLMDSTRHEAFTGVGNERILENVAQLSRTGRNVIIRIPLIAGVNDDAGNIQATIDFLKTDTRFRTVHLLPYHRLGEGKVRNLGKEEVPSDLQAPSEDGLGRITQQFSEQGFVSTIGG